MKLKSLVCVCIMVPLGLSLVACEKKAKSPSPKENEKQEAFKAWKYKTNSFVTADKTLGSTKVLTSSMAKKMEPFLAKVKEGKKAKIVLYDRTEEESMNREAFSFQGETMYLDYINVSKDENGKPVVATSEKTKVESWKYTKKGWFIYTLEAPESTEEVDTTAMIRVKPWNSKMVQMAKEYLLPIGYHGNNLFLSNWDAKNMKNIDYNGLYESLYQVKYKKSWKWNDDTTTISKKDMENLMTEYLPVSANQVEQSASYQEGKQVYDWAKLGCGNYTPNAVGTSIPEIVKIEEKKDKTTVLTIDVVCEMLGEDKVYTHELTVRFLENGKIQYLKNQILGDGEKEIPKYRYRISKKAER